MNGSAVGFRLVSLVLFASALGLGGAARAEVTLGKLFSDNMMFQRNRPIRVWGTAAPGEAVTVTLAGKTAETKADGTGAWIVELPPLAEGRSNPPLGFAFAAAPTFGRGLPPP
jgi:sialate O-acetylesterase